MAKGQTGKRSWFSRGGRSRSERKLANQEEEENAKAVFGGKTSAHSVAAFEVLVSLLETRGLERAGLFRVPGNAEASAEASRRLDAGEPASEVLEWLGSVVDSDSLLDSAATLLKQWVRCRPTEVLPEALRHELARLCAAGDFDSMAAALPRPSALWDLCVLLGKVAEASHLTRMPPYNLAVVFAPNLVDDPLLSVGPLVEVVSKLISSVHDLKAREVTSPLRQENAFKKHAFHAVRESDEREVLDDDCVDTHRYRVNDDDDDHIGLGRSRETVGSSRRRVPAAAAPTTPPSSSRGGGAAAAAAAAGNHLPLGDEDEIASEAREPSSTTRKHRSNSAPNRLLRRVEHKNNRAGRSDLAGLPVDSASDLRDRDMASDVATSPLRLEAQVDPGGVPHRPPPPPMPMQTPTKQTPPPMPDHTPRRAENAASRTRDARPARPRSDIALGTSCPNPACSARVLALETRVAALDLENRTLRRQLSNLLARHPDDSPQGAI